MLKNAVSAICEALEKINHIKATTDWQRSTVLATQK